MSGPSHVRLFLQPSVCRPHALQPLRSPHPSQAARYCLDALWLALAVPSDKRYKPQWISGIPIVPEGGIRSGIVLLIESNVQQLLTRPRIDSLTNRAENPLAAVTPTITHRPSPTYPASWQIAAVGDAQLTAAAA